MTLAIVAVWLSATVLGHYMNACATVGVAAIGTSIVVLALQRELFKRLFRASARDIAIGLAAGALMVAATYLLFPVVTNLIPSTLGATQALYRLMGVPHATALVLVILTLIIAGEEILWRGVAQEAIGQRLGPALAVPAGAIVYGLAHSPIGSPLLVAVAVACGLFWSLLRWKSGSLLPSLIAHVIWDFAILLHPVVRI